MLKKYSSYYDELKELAVEEGHQDPRMHYTGMFIEDLDNGKGVCRLMFHPHATESDKAKITSVILKYHPDAVRVS